jgi:hypothetical protein
VMSARNEAEICNNPDFIKNRFDLMFPGAMIANAAGSYKVGDGVSFLYANPSPKRDASTLKSAPKIASLCPLNKCPNYELLEALNNLYGDIPSGDKVKDIMKLANVSYDSSLCSAMCAELSSAARKHSSTLLAITTSNLFEMTAGFLSLLDSVKDDFDLVFIDDNSSDGTVEYLVKKVTVVRGTGLHNFTHIYIIYI